MRAMLAMGLCSEARRSAMRLEASPRNSECSSLFHYTLPPWSQRRSTEITRHLRQSDCDEVSSTLPDVAIFRPPLRSHADTDTKKPGCLVRFRINQPQTPQHGRVILAARCKNVSAWMPRDGRYQAFMRFANWQSVDKNFGQRVPNLDELCVFAYDGK